MRKALLLSLLLFLAGGVLSKREGEVYLPPEPLSQEVPEDLQALLSVRTVDEARPDIWPVVGIITSDYGWRRIRGRRVG